MQIRLDKFLSDMSVGTRSEVKALIKSGKVQVNDKVIKDFSEKINTQTDFVSCNGIQIGYQKYEYYMLNKPAGVITATEDKKEKTVLDLLKDSGRKDLFPVGRLDKDTVGLLLLTNDGGLSHKMLSPKKHVDKTYFVRINGNVTAEMKQALEEGVFIEKDVKSRPAKLEVLLNEEDEAEVFLTIHEGRFHQVKKMFEAVGRTVIYLKRTGFGPLVLDETLKEGEYRRLTEPELELLKDWRTNE